MADTPVICSARRPLSDTAVVIITCAVVLAASLLGILSRPMGVLASIWPANAILLGVLVRFPQLARRPGWLGATAGYLAADLLTGSALLTTVLLTIANLAGVGTGYALLRRLDENQRSLHTPLSVPYLVMASIAAALAAAIVGAIVEPFLFGGEPLEILFHWLINETAYYILLLPAFLTLPTKWRLQQAWPYLRGLVMGKWLRALPLASLVLSWTLCVLVGGPGAVAFPVPALLWCALRYVLFVTAVLTLLTSGWLLVSIELSQQAMAIFEMSKRDAIQSLRLGIALLALAPLTVASVMATHSALLDRLRHLATHDQLTNLLNRGAFREKGVARLQELRLRNRPVAVLMLDIDHFKNINDTYGHHTGDEVLKRFAERARSCLREWDILARVGGEEFAVMLPDCTPQQAQAIAERIRAGFSDHPIDVAGTALNCSVSIGAAIKPAAKVDLDALLQAADETLYVAKNSGRNRVVATIEEH